MMGSLRRQRRLEKKWNSVFAESNDDLDFAQKWVRELYSALLTHRHDRQFKEDVLESAVSFWESKMDDHQKTDVFIYLLGFLSRK
jgi:hypothetical protein